MLAYVDSPDRMRKICNLPHLPPLPVIAQRILELVTDEEVDIRRLATTIEQDPGVMARIIGLANSAYFGQPHQIYTVQDAIVRVLGLKAVGSLAIGILLSSPFDASKCRNFDLPRYWHAALLSAMIARSLAPLVDTEVAINEDSAYLGGLLHNIGILVLIHCFPEQMRSVIELKHNEPGSRLTDLEHETLSLDHHAAGGVVARRWHLPKDVVAVIEHHSNSDYAGEFWQQTLLIGLASRMANRIIDEGEFQIDTPAIELLGIDPQQLETVLTSLAGQSEGIAAMSRILAMD